MAKYYKIKKEIRFDQKQTKELLKAIKKPINKVTQVALI